MDRLVSSSGRMEGLFEADFLCGGLLSGMVEGKKWKGGGRKEEEARKGYGKGMGRWKGWEAKEHFLGALPLPGTKITYTHSQR